MPAGLSGPSLLPPHSSQLELVLGMWRWSWSPGKPCLGVPMCFQEREAKDITGVNISCKFLCLLTMYRTLMATGRGSLALAILLATMDIQLGGEDRPPIHISPRQGQPSGKILNSWGMDPKVFFSAGEERDPLPLDTNERVKNIAFLFLLKLLLLPSPMRHSASAMCC